MEGSSGCRYYCRSVADRDSIEEADFVKDDEAIDPSSSDSVQIDRHNQPTVP